MIQPLLRLVIPSFSMFSPRFFPWFFPWPVVPPQGGRDDAPAGGCDAGGLGRGLGLDHQVPLGAFFRAFGGSGGGDLGGGGLDGGWGVHSGH